MQRLLFVAIALAGCAPNSSTQFVSGTNSLITLERFSNGSTCQSGVVVQSGPDENRNGILEAEEIQSTQSVCDGETVIVTNPVSPMPIPSPDVSPTPSPKHGKRHGHTIH